MNSQPTDALTAAKLTKLQTNLRTMIENIDTIERRCVADVAQIDARKRQAEVSNIFTGVINSWISGPYDTAKETFAGISDDWDLAKRNTLQPFLSTGKLEGRTLTVAEAESLIRYTVNFAGYFKDAVDIVRLSEPTGVFSTAVRSFFSDVFGILNSLWTFVKNLVDQTIILANKLIRVIQSAADIAVDLAAGAAGVASALPIILGVVILGPLLLRTFSSYKRGGVTAAADTAAGQLEVGRRRIMSVGRGAVQAGKTALKLL